MNVWPWSKKPGYQPVERRRTDRRHTLAEHHHSLVEDIRREATELSRALRDTHEGGRHELD